ncbi:HK97 family phage prohead protease [Consotaella aegiceratis]|uniref:HK97 family phage prohead protease n=1 Tax=Consotaella aegiceratis TaxID=3097961 RepID=UPI002F41082C
MTGALLAKSGASQLQGIVRGYASLFGRTDQAGDRIERGAFVASLARRGAAGVRMLWQHDPSQPIGVWTHLREDATGLFVEGRLTLASARAREVAALIAARAVDGLSIGFRTRHARRGGAGSKRVLTEIDLWEVSIVTFPMQSEARLART